MKQKAFILSNKKYHQPMIFSICLEFNSQEIKKYDTEISNLGIPQYR